MIKKTFLVEIGTEELPAKILKNIILIFYKNFINELNSNKILYEKINYFYTPRRLALQIIELDTSERTHEIVKKGPSIQNAFDKYGNFTQEARCWAKNCKVNLNLIHRLKTQKGEWIIHRIKEKQEKIELLLPKIIETSLKNINIKNTMKWEINNFKFYRPIRNIVMMLDDVIIKSVIFNILSNNILHNHISFKEQKIYIKHAKDYPSILFDKNKIIADYKIRKEKIKKEINKSANKIGGIIKKDDLLIEEVNCLVESPKALLASFQKMHVNYIPHKILIYIIKKQQKCFPVYNKKTKEKILPHFIFITNVDSRKNKNIISGNEKVMHARLSDAIFFLKKDQEIQLEQYLPFLKNVLFYNHLGTLYDKTVRLKTLINLISSYIKNIDVNNLIRSATLSKCDLVTNMGYEFPELQGTIGMYYALKNQEKKEIAIAIQEQYLPSFSGDKLPSTSMGCLLSISDKIDTLSGMFGIGEIPSSEKDPFGLRRTALSILRIIIEKKIPIDLKKIVQNSLETYNFKKINSLDILKKIIDFFMSRLSFFYENKGYNIKIVKSVLSCQLTEPLDIDKRIKAISDCKKIQSIILTSKRINNMLKNNNKTILEKINIKLINKAEEKILLKKIKMFHNKTKKLFIEKKYKKILLNIKELEEPINNFFDKVKINHSNDEVKKNRLLILIKVEKIFSKITNFLHLY